MSQAPASDDDLLYDVCDDVGIVTLNRPESRNALTFEMYERLAEVCAGLTIDGPVRGLIITGSGKKAFAAGTDISRFRDFSTAEDAIQYERKMDRVLGTLEAVPVPTIAAICGACTGGGAAIAAACDLRVSDEHLKFGFPIARTLGNCLSIGNLARLTSLLGAARTKEIIFTARLVLAKEAEAIGLVGEVVEDPMARARELATLMAGHAPLTLQATKEALRRLRTHSAEPINGDDLVIQCYTSEDFREGLEAFLGKRKPGWKGK